jgi:hypothetical protein
LEDETLYIIIDQLNALDEKSDTGVNSKSKMDIKIKCAISIFILRVLRQITNGHFNIRRRILMRLRWLFMEDTKR